MIRTIIATVALVGSFLAVLTAADAKDRACTRTDVARFEAMMGGTRAGQYRTDPRFQITLHYLGTRIVHGVCNVQLAPAD